MPRFVGTVQRPAIRGVFNLGPIIHTGRRYVFRTREAVEPRTIEVVAEDMEDAKNRVDWYYPKSEGWQVELTERG